MRNLENAYFYHHSPDGAAEREIQNYDNDKNEIQNFNFRVIMKSSPQIEVH